MRYIIATGQRSASFVCAQSNQNNYTNDLWTHYLIYFIRLSGSFELHGQIISARLWLGYFCNELDRRKNAENKKVRSHLTAHVSRPTLPRAIALHLYILAEIIPLCQQELLVTFFLLWGPGCKKAVQHFRGEKWLAANIDCHCWESKRERNERKQVHLPQVYNPEITVCSGACLTALQAACASLLISSAPAVQELIWRFSESITLLSKVPLPERHTHTCTCAHVRTEKQMLRRTHTRRPIHPAVVNTHSRRLITQPSDTRARLEPDLEPLWGTLYSRVGGR